MQRVDLSTLMKDGAFAAVHANAGIVARMLGYEDPKQTPVKRVTIFKDGLGVELVIGEGTYASATFAHACCLIEGQERGSAETDEMRRASIDAEVLRFMRQYMGERIMTDAEDPNGSAHRFVRSILKAEGGVLLISFAPGKKLQ